MLNLMSSFLPFFSFAGLFSISFQILLLLFNLIPMRNELISLIQFRSQTGKEEQKESDLIRASAPIGRKILRRGRKHAVASLGQSCAMNETKKRSDGSRH
jgi:hypothetical protein